MKKDSQQSPMVTVVITTYNRADMVGRAIQSVLNQTHKDFELIVVDDCSTDNTEEVIKAFHDSHLCYIRHDKNRRLPAARNTGMKAAQGKYLAFLDDDDEWLPDRLKLQVEAAEQKDEGYGGFYCGYAYYLEDGALMETIPWQKGDIMSSLLKGWTPPCSGSMFRRDALEEVEGFDEGIKSGVDHDVWFTLATAGYKFDFVPYGLVITNRNQDKIERMTTNPRKRIPGIKALCKKWKPVIQRAIGKKGYKKFRRRYLSREYRSFVFGGIKLGYLQKLKYLILSILYYPTNIKTWLMFFVLLFSSRYGLKWVLVHSPKRKFSITDGRQHVKYGIGIPGL